ncbi:MAG: hypothetical protein EOR84_02945 [Mesorhizobium sp.]|uniref:hypothetical protein n=1 Tax=Mesorhizobium sp. TaxID=1871066 RepID=UPI000FE6BC8D|nr:hypothetical protein [Mesorhizobium sp.]RWN02691.1 MAG: hypothetical protein EOR84_02945 [Mesorhizobium sp.]
MDLVAFLQTNWAVVMQAPWVFVTFAALFGGGGFLIGHYWLSERVANLESRLARRDEEIAAHRSTQAAPAEPSRDKLTAQRVAFVQDLTRLYTLSHDGISPEMIAGFALPPVAWLNEQLESQGKAWRVRNINGRNFEIVDLSSA